MYFMLIIGGFDVVGFRKIFREILRNFFFVYSMLFFVNICVFIILWDFCFYSVGR